jgi:hypothetical protein
VRDRVETKIFSFSHFRENLYSFSRKYSSENIRNFRESFREDAKMFSFSTNITIFGQSLMVFGQKKTKKNIINHLSTKQLNMYDTFLFTQNFALLGKLQIRALR